MLNGKEIVKLSAAIAVVLGAAGPLSAALLNIDVNGRNSGDGVPVTYSGAAGTGSAGDFWNGYLVDSSAAGGNVDPSQSGFLKNSAGATTAVRFDIDSSNGDSVANDPNGNSNNDLLNDYAAVRGSNAPGVNPVTSTFTISGLLANTSYELFLYGSPGNYGGNASVYTFGADSFTVQALATGNGTFDQDTDNGGADLGNFGIIHVTSDGSGKIVGVLTAGVSNSYGVLNGLQIVGSIPVPTPAALPMGLALMGGFAMRRRVR